MQLRLFFVLFVFILPVSSRAAFPHLFVIGLAVGWLRHRSGTLWPCFALHLTHNGLVLASEYLWI